jgi:hypothetical protein
MSHAIKNKPFTLITVNSGDIRPEKSQSLRSPFFQRAAEMTISLRSEEYELDQLITQIEFDIISVEAIIEKLIRQRKLKVSTLIILTGF